MDCDRKFPAISAEAASFDWVCQTGDAIGAVASGEYVDAAIAPGWVTPIVTMVDATDGCCVEDEDASVLFADDGVTGDKDELDERLVPDKAFTVVMKKVPVYRWTCGSRGGNGPRKVGHENGCR